MEKPTDYQNTKDGAEKGNYQECMNPDLYKSMWNARKIGFKKGYELGKAHATKKVDRTMIAAMAMQGLLSNFAWMTEKIEYIRRRYKDDVKKAAEVLKHEIAEEAVECADALLAELEK